MERKENPQSNVPIENTQCSPESIKQDEEERQKWEKWLKYIAEAEIDPSLLPSDPNAKEAEIKKIREQNQSLLETCYKDHESRYIGALSYLSGDFVQFLIFNVQPSLSPEGEPVWTSVHYPIKTVEAHYSEHPRYPLFAPILFEATPEEVSKQNELVRRMNEAIRQKNVEEINKICEEAEKFADAIKEKLKDALKKKNEKNTSPNNE